MSAADARVKRAVGSARYHHGDLKSVLLTLAQGEVECVGHEALELQVLAVAAGVSRAAPYRHFRNREDLLIALGVRGFAMLKERNARAVAGNGSAGDRLRAVCLALIGFSMDRPQLYRMMFASGLMRTLYSPQTWGDVVRESYELFESAMAATMPDAPRRDVRAATLACLASLQGFISMRDSARMEYLLVDGETEDSLLEKILAPHLPPQRRGARGPLVKE